MKKIYLLIILFLGIYPFFKNGKLKIINASNLLAQSASTVLQGFLIKQNQEIYGNNGHTFLPTSHGCGCEVREDLTNGTYILHKSTDYHSSPAFQNYLSSSNTTLPPTSNENQGGNTQANWVEIQMQLDMIRSQERTDAISDALNWVLNSTGGNEQTNNPPPCEESMWSISNSRDIFNGTLPPNIYPNATYHGNSNLTCANNFLIGGNIISFNSPHLSNIETYAFAENELKSVKFYNGDIYRRAIDCNVIIETTSISSFSGFCPPSNESSFTMLVNKVASYKYVCFPKINTIGGVFEDFSSYGEVYYGGIVPPNLAGKVFTIPNTHITPAQPGSIVLGINASNAYSCQTLDCANVAGGTANNDNCGACTGGTTGVQPCPPTQCATNVIFNKHPSMLFGIDKFTNSNIPWKSIEQNKSDTLQIQVTPSNKFNTVILKDTPVNIITTSPNSASSAAFNLKITASALPTGVNKIETQIKSNCNIDSTNIKKLNIVSYRLVSKTIAVRLVHSKPNISIGYSGYNSTNVSDVDIINYLNKKTYCQGVVKWTIIRLPAKTVNFDLNKDGKIDTDNWMSAEMSVIRDSCKADIYDVNVFLVDKGSFVGGTGFSDFNQKYVYVHADLSFRPINTIAHEIGHAAFGFSHTPSDSKNVMYDLLKTDNDEFRKNQWDLMR